MMTYEEIRIAAFQKKKSHYHQKMRVTDYGNFAVCQSNKMDAMIVDSDIANIIADRLWCEDSQGYAISRIAGENIRLHDFVMAFHANHKPEGMFVDHINRDKKDNRITNLRFVSPYENTLNMSLRRVNRCGVTGVSKTKKGKYRAYITYKGKQINLGHYETIDEARQARIEGEQRFGYKSRPASVADKCNLAFLAELER